MVRVFDSEQKGSGIEAQYLSIYLSIYRDAISEVLH